MNSYLEILENVPLAPLTTLGVGGEARFFTQALRDTDLNRAIEFARSKSLEVFILGGGSNVLIADSGFDGLVIQIAISGVREVSVSDDIVVLEVGAGEDWDQFVALCVERELAGVECLSGIPGSIGGTPVQNVGAYGQEVSETIREVRCFDCEKNVFVTLSSAECEFSYRRSIFNSSARGRYVVVSVVFALEKVGEPRIVYSDLVDHFGGRTPTLAETRDAVLAIRRTKSMVIDARDPNSRSAGSFFKNPVVEKERFAEVIKSFPNVPCFEAEEKVKIPAAWLIENAGFYKGYVAGEAGISSRHTLALINRGGASAADILVLMEKIRDAVAKKFGIELVPEPVFVGF